MYRNKTGWILPALCLLLTACSNQGTSTAAKEELVRMTEANVHTTTVTRGDYVITSTATGKAAYPLGADLSWDREDCRYAEILVEKGDVVEEGQALIRFSYEGSSLEMEEASLRLARLQDAYAEGLAEREQDLTEAREDRNDLTGSDWDEAGLEIDRMEAALDAYVCEMEYQISELEISMEEMTETMERDTLCAPFSGVIDQVPAGSVGDKAATDRPLIKMHSESKVLFACDNAKGSFTYGMPVTVTINGHDYDGHVIEADNALPIELRGLSMLVEMDTPEGADALLATESGYGVSVTGKTVYARNALMADRLAFSLDGGQYYVQILDDEGQIHNRPVIIGSDNSNGNGREIWILEGVDEGDTLVIQNG